MSLSDEFLLAVKEWLLGKFDMKPPSEEILLMSPVNGFVGLVFALHFKETKFLAKVRIFRIELKPVEKGTRYLVNFIQIVEGKFLRCSLCIDP